MQVSRLVSEWSARLADESAAAQARQEEALRELRTLHAAALEKVRGFRGFRGFCKGARILSVSEPRKCAFFCCVFTPTWHIAGYHQELKAKDERRRASGALAEGEIIQRAVGDLWVCGACRDLGCPFTYTGRKQKEGFSVWRRGCDTVFRSAFRRLS
jgi:hypothetical protein